MTTDTESCKVTLVRSRARPAVTSTVPAVVREHEWIKHSKTGKPLRCLHCDTKYGTEGDAGCQRIEPGDRIEVVEGSWAGRTGEVVRPGPTSQAWDKTFVLVAFDDGAEQFVVGCTMARL